MENVPIMLKSVWIDAPINSPFSNCQKDPKNKNPKDRTGIGRTSKCNSCLFVSSILLIFYKINICIVDYDLLLNISIILICIYSFRVRKCVRDHTVNLPSCLLYSLFVDI